jgi:hypothetical protein
MICFYIFSQKGVKIHEKMDCELPVNENKLIYLVLSTGWVFFRHWMKHIVRFPSIVKERGRTWKP